MLLLIIGRALLSIMRGARAGLAELVSAGSGEDQLRRAEGRFRALAATARELEEFEPGPTPGRTLQARSP